MKKVLAVLSIVLCLFLTGCKKTTYTEINYNEFQNKLNNKESFVIVMGSSTCSACAAYKPTMEEVIKDKQIEIFYIDLEKISADEKMQMRAKYGDSTPTTLFIKDGQEMSAYNRIVGNAGYSEVVENLKNYGYIGD